MKWYEFPLKYCLQWLYPLIELIDMITSPPPLRELSCFPLDQRIIYLSLCTFQACFIVIV